MCNLNLPESCKNIPYFGSMYCANQVNRIRIAPMRQLITMELKRPHKPYIFNLLEVGSWAGESAILWADKMQELGVNGRVTCIDQWKPYCEMASMDKELEDGRIFELFLYNIEKSQSGHMVQYFRGDSRRLLPMFRANSLDMVYIDGDHSYRYVKSDIRNAMRIVKIGGVISGDDLELQLDDLLPNLNTDDIPLVDPYIQCHLGVTTAVWEIFKRRISSWQGFWAVRKKSTKSYIDIILE